MSKTTLQQELDDIVRMLGQFPDGADIRQIAQALTTRFSRRTLQRRLSLLAQLNRIVIEGQTRQRRYHARVESVERVPDECSVEFQGEVSIPMTEAGYALKQAIRQPIQHRTPVGYEQEFLHAYRPNETFYLPLEMRRRLLHMGHTLPGQHPAGTYVRQIFNRLLIDLSWNSSRLEGNTYSLLETERLLQFGDMAQGKDRKEAQMILNHKAAIEFLVDIEGRIDFSRYTLLNLHALLANNLLADSLACGRLRAIPVGIGGTVYHPLEVPQLVDEYFQQILDTAGVIRDPFEQSFFVMVHLPYLQPFEDVNKRVSRLAANLPLIRHNLSPLSFVDVPERAYIDATLGVYELNNVALLRDVYQWAYERSCARYSAVRKSLGEPDPFRLHYRTRIAETILAVVQGKMDKQIATIFIQKRAATELPDVDAAKFVETIETELMSLHEGNIARYRLRPSEFAEWQVHWR